MLIRKRVLGKIMKLEYPAMERVDQKDDFHGTVVEDPYRYMEDPEDHRTLEFIEKNNSLVNRVIETERIDFFKQRFTKDYENYEVIMFPMKRAGKYYYQLRSGVQPQPIIYSQNDEKKAILDINSLSEDGTTASTGMSVSPDGKILTVNLSIHGSDWQDILIMDMDSGKQLERLRWVRFTSIAWKEDSSGFYYQKFPDQTNVSEEDRAKHAKLFLHIIGTPQETDTLIFTPEDKTFMATPVMHSDENMFIYSSNSTMPENALFYMAKGGSIIPIVPHQNGYTYNVIGTVGRKAYLLTSQDSPNLRITVLDLDNPDISKMETVVPEGDDAIAFATLTSNRIAIVYLKDAHHQLKFLDLEGNLVKNVDFPTMGSVLSVWGRPDDDDFIYMFESYFHPRVAYVYNHGSGETEILGNYPYFGSDQFTMKQVFYTSKDGTKIPMYITYKKGIKLDGNNPTYLYGYGGFKISLTPNYQPHFLTWLRNGGIYAVANLRGGGEYGKTWHDQALLEKKQNVFDDFIAAAEYLISEGYTNPKKLAINGRSNGGLLVGAVMTQRPDLYGAVVPQVGVLDMLRYHRFTIGRFWLKEYGDPQDPDHFRFLIKYSPLHNIRKGVEYPPTLVTAAEGDNRVVPAHTLKFVATLQHTYEGDNPILMRIERKAGHGFGKPLTKVIEDLAYKFAFISQMLEVNLS